jgi:hypothetical protein
MASTSPLPSLFLVLLAAVLTTSAPGVIAFAPITAKVRSCLSFPRTIQTIAGTSLISDHDLNNGNNEIKPSSSTIDNSRKKFLHAMFTSAISTTIMQPTVASAASTSSKGAAAFLGTYSDPINHPGGTRTITLIDGASNGDYQLAQVKGGGGRGEPTEYILPAVIFGDRAIVIDFSPKGGPRDFAGVLESDGSIRFVRDGNRWPRL